MTDWKKAMLDAANEAKALNAPIGVRSVNAGYFSASDRATALAAGVNLLAIVQNMPGSKVAGSDELHAWDAWQVTYGLRMTATAREFQREMMDSAIHGDWQ